MRVFLYAPIHYERWDWRNVEDRGIGGSETAVVETAWRLAKRGHEVIVYAPIPEDCPGQWQNTKWIRCEDARLDQAGLWIVSRDATASDIFGPRRPEQPRWLVC